MHRIRRAAAAAILSVLPAAATMGGDSPCPNLEHACIAEGSPGCADAACCETVCLADPFCCQESWDALCVAEALAWCYPPLLCNSLCPADLQVDGIVNGADLGVLLGAWSTTGGCADLDADGSVNAADIAVLLGSWGTCSTDCTQLVLELGTARSELASLTTGTAAIDPNAPGRQRAAAATLLLPGLDLMLQRLANTLALISSSASGAPGCPGPEELVRAESKVNLSQAELGRARLKLVYLGNPSLTPSDVTTTKAALQAQYASADAWLSGAMSQLSGATLCPPAPDHDCCSEGSPGCTDGECCESVCAVDPFCCVVGWDATCVGEAAELCGCP